SPDLFFASFASGARWSGIRTVSRHKRGAAEAARPDARVDHGAGRRHELVDPRLRSGRLVADDADAAVLGALEGVEHRPRPPVDHIDQLAPARTPSVEHDARIGAEISERGCEPARPEDPDGGAQPEAVNGRVRRLQRTV